MGEPELSKGESCSPGAPAAPGFPSPLGGPIPQDKIWATRLGLASRQHHEPALAKLLGGGSSRESLAQPMAKPRAASTSFPPAHLFSLWTWGATRVSLQCREEGVSLGAPLQSHCLQSRECRSPMAQASYRLPWKTDPRRSWLPRGPWLPSQPLGSHQPRVTLEGKGGVSAGDASGCPGSHAFTPKPQLLPSAPWVPPHRSLRAGPAGEERGVSAPHVQHHGEGGPAAEPHCPGGAPGDAQVPPSTTHIAPRAPRLAL